MTIFRAVLVVGVIGSVPFGIGNVFFPSLLYAKDSAITNAFLIFIPQIDEVRDTTHLEHQLETAKEADRIPILLELAKLRYEEPAVVIDLTNEALVLLGKFPSAPQEIEVRIARSWALRLQSDYPSALAEAQHAERLAREENRKDLIAQASYQVAYVEWRMANFTDALSKAKVALQLQEPHGKSKALASTLSLIGAIQQSLSNYEAALENGLASLRMSEDLGDERAAARLHNNIGMIYWDLGRHEDAYDALMQALEIHERLGSKGDLSNTLNNIGLVLIELDRPSEALPYLERALKLDEEVGDLYGQAKVFSNLGYAYEKLDKPQRAFGFHKKALALRERIGDKDGIVRTSSVLADLWLQYGETEAAIEILEKALALAIEINERRDQAYLLETLSRAYEALGDTSGALAAYRRFHKLETELAGSETNRRIVELEAQYQAKKRERDLLAVEALAQSRMEKLKWLIIGSGLLGGCLILLGVLFALRVRAQRALVESEQRYRTLFHTSVIPTLLIEIENRRIIDFNDPAQKLCSNLSAKVRVMVDDLEPEWIRVALCRLLDSNTDKHLALDDCWIERSGRTRWWEIRGSLVSLGGRKCQLLNIRDTTEIRVQEEFRLRQSKLESLGVLAGGIAHDFNNALAAVIGYMELAKDGKPYKRKHMLELAEQAATRARRLTQQLLTFAKGGKPIRKITDIGKLLREDVELAGSGSHLKIQVDIPDDLWYAHVDISQFSQVVSNLVINAQQATKKGDSLYVRASNFHGDPITSTLKGDQRYVRIDFEDSGVGIPEKIRDQVFDPYFTTKTGNSGLGLATAYAICNNHGGTITFKSRVGYGTTFTVLFPAASKEESKSDSLPAKAPKGEGTMLVLDDEPLLQDVIRHMLEQWGFEVEVVADGKNAIQLYIERLNSGKPFDLLIMDLTIPGGMGGRQAIAEILKHDPNARAIAVSGYSDDPTMADYREAGFLASLAKPFQLSELAHLVSNILQISPS